MSKDDASGYSLFMKSMDCGDLSASHEKEKTWQISYPTDGFSWRRGSCVPGQSSDCDLWSARNTPSSMISLVTMKDSPVRIQAVSPIVTKKSMVGEFLGSRCFSYNF